MDNKNVSPINVFYEGMSTLHSVCLYSYGLRLLTLFIADWVLEIYGVCDCICGVNGFFDERKLRGNVIFIQFCGVKIQTERDWANKKYMMTMREIAYILNKRCNKAKQKNIFPFHTFPFIRNGCGHMDYWLSFSANNAQSISTLGLFAGNY